MAEITITIPDGILGRVTDAIAKRLGYDYAKLEGETKNQFAKRMVIQEVKGWVVDQEAIDARNSQESTSDSEIDIN